MDERKSSIFYGSLSGVADGRLSMFIGSLWPVISLFCRVGGSFLLNYDNQSMANSKTLAWLITTYGTKKDLTGEDRK